MTKPYQSPVKRTEAEQLLPLALPMIEEGKMVKITVTGFSMYPLVSSRRDAVLLAKAEDLQVGDVPLFQRADGSYILHRIIEERNGAYVTMGDYETEEEYPVKKEQVVAKAIGFYRKNKYIYYKSFGYRVYSFLWRKTLKIRPFLLNTMASMGAYKKKLTK